MKKQKNITILGQRLKNPLNIRNYSEAAVWVGQRPTTGAFCEFDLKVYGYRAAFITLHTYFYGHQCRTVRTIINRWAPPTDGNDTQGYIKYVCNVTGLLPDMEISYRDEEKMVNLVEAMAQMETASFHEKEIIVDAYHMALKTKKME